jgi:hypothetical protein
MCQTISNVIEPIASTNSLEISILIAIALTALIIYAIIDKYYLNKVINNKKR